MEGVEGGRLGGERVQRLAPTLLKFELNEGGRVRVAQ